MKVKETTTLAEINRSTLIDKIADTLHSVRSHQLPSVCERLGLESGTSEEAFSSKRSYVKNRIKAFDNKELLQFARKVNREYSGFMLSEFLHALDEEMDDWSLTDITRTSILTAFNDIALFGEHGRVCIRGYWRQLRMSRSVR